MSEAEALCGPVRQFTDGLAVGLGPFLERTFQMARNCFGPRRRDGARKSESSRCSSSVGADPCVRPSAANPQPGPNQGGHAGPPLRVMSMGKSMARAGICGCAESAKRIVLKRRFAALGRLFLTTSSDTRRIAAVSKHSPISFTPLGGGREIGANSYLIRTDEQQFVIDQLEQYIHGH